ncbi:hypothetical protein GCM10018953_73980 [Streptosporangium nondiastaticum]
MRSRRGPPNTMAPMRPLPTGRASIQFPAGRAYQSLRAMSLLREPHGAKVIHPAGTVTTRGILPDTRNFPDGRPPASVSTADQGPRNPGTVFDTKNDLERSIASGFGV